MQRSSQPTRHGRRGTATALIALVAAGLLAACGEEPPPTSVTEFVENPILLEATMVRCVGNRAETRYDPECLNAREAVDRIAAREQAARRADLEEQSERKREALRRAQEAAAEARRRALEEQRRREEAELLGPFAPLPEGEARPETGAPREESPAGQAPGQLDEPPLPEPEPPPQEDSPPPAEKDDAAPTAELSSGPPASDPAASDLETIRRELERRQDESGQKP